MMETYWEYWLEATTYPETIELHELLPGARESDVWDDTDLDLKQQIFQGVNKR